MDNNRLQKWNARKNKIFKPLIDEMSLCTLCFFEDHQKLVSKPVGSGIFAEIQGEYYVISAAHVLAEHFHNTYLIIGDDAITLGGKAISSPLPITKNRTDDKIDLSVLKLDKTSTEAILKRFKPLSIDKFVIRHKIIDKPDYFSYGYPLTKTRKIWGKDEIKSIGYAYQSQPAKGFSFKKFGFSEDTHIAIAYNRKVTSAEDPNEHYTPDLTGISGSGLWLRHGFDQISFLGIVIEQVNKFGNQAIVATRVEEILKIISRF